MMTRKHYQLIADVLSARIAQANADRVVADRSSAKTAAAHRQAMVEMIAHDMADALARQNPNFNRSRFLSACGVTA